MKKVTLQKGIKLMLDFSQNNKDNKAKAKFMASWIYKYFGEKQKIKQVRFDAFVAHDKDPYICYRFVIALEKLLPLRFTQLKPVAVDENTSPIGEQIIIEIDPIKVAERYLQKPVYEDVRVRFGDSWYLEITELAHQYMDYLYSNALDRLRMWEKDREKWEKFI